jgi:hypothetical protein
MPDVTPETHSAKSVKVKPSASFKPGAKPFTGKDVDFTSLVDKV